MSKSDTFNCNNCATSCGEHAKYDSKGVIVFRKNSKIKRCAGFSDYKPLSADRDFRAVRGLRKV